MKKIIGLLTIAAILLLGISARAGLLSRLFSANYLPHRYCYLAQPALVWTNVTMDGLIAASYGLLFLCLFWISYQLSRKQAVRSYLWIFLAFGTFILACGGTHLMEMVTVWWPVYPLSAAVKVVCAAASVLTAILFARASPALASNIVHFLDMLSTSQQEKQRALTALVASEKLAVAGRISASIAHEIKNPLSSVADLIFLVAGDERLPSELLPLLKSASSELARATATAHATLSIFQESSTPVTIAIADVVSSVLELQSAQLLICDVGVQTRLRTILPLKAYSGELQQMLINLIQNAAVAIGSGGRIRLRIQPRHLLKSDSPRLAAARFGSAPSTRLLGQPGYSITVADTGKGISPPDRSRLFTLFFTTKGEEGTGVGLWLVRSMVEKQGGRIVFRSRTASESPRPGTLFNIWIPLVPAHLPAETLQPEMFPASSNC